jgi:hypothetical protein
MVTAEYVVGTLAAASVAGVLVALGADDWLLDLLWDLVRSALRPGVLLDQLHHLPWLGDR